MAVDIPTARDNIVNQLVDGAPNTITPSKLRQLLTDVIDAINNSLLPFSKIDATTPPSVNDDGVNSSGFGTFVPGSKWYDQVAGEAYECIDNSTAAAVWVPSSFDVSDVGTAALFDVGTDVNEIVQLDGAGKLPAVDGSQLVNLPGLPELGNLATLDQVAGGQIDNNAVDSQHVANGAIDFAHLADVVDEDDMVSDSAAKIPTQQSVKAYVDSQSPGLVLLSTATASNSSSVVFTSGIDDTYDQYIVECIGAVPVTNNDTLMMRTSSDGGANYDVGSADYSHVYLRLMDGSTSNTVYQDTGDTAADLGSTIGNTAGEHINSSIKIYNPAGTTLRKTMQYDSVMVRENGETQRQTGLCTRESTAAINALQFLFKSGNIASGTFKLYGVR